MARKPNGKKVRFKRQEVNVQKSLKDTWRRPSGRKSDLRREKKSRGNVPKIGYGSPLSVRGLNSLGLRETRVFRLDDLKKLDPKKESIIIAKAVGKKKRIEIIKEAENLGLRISNFKV